MQTDGVSAIPALSALPAMPPTSVPYPSLEALASIAEGIGTSGGGEVGCTSSLPATSQTRVPDCTGLCITMPDACHDGHRLYVMQHFAIALLLRRMRPACDHFCTVLVHMWQCLRSSLHGRLQIQMRVIWQASRGSAGQHLMKLRRA